MKKISLGLLIMILITVGCSNNMDEKSKQSESKKSIEETLIGTWSGAIKIPNQQLNIIVEFTNDEPLEANISIPVQNVEDFSLSEVMLEGEEVSFSMPISGQSIHFTGAVSDQTLSGTFTQAGQSFPFELQKGNAKSAEAVDEEFLTIETYTGTMYGSLMTPDEGDTHPIALIIPGSGPTDRNGNSPAIQGENNSLKLVAEALADQGIASLRYDKRGAGKNVEAVTSQGDMRFEQFVNDAVQWLETLDNDERFTEIAVIGHSQGSLVGMMAAESATTDAFVSIAGAGNTIDEVLDGQLKEALSEDLYKESQSILEQLRQGKIVENMSDPLKGTFNPDVQPFLISWMKYDPVEQIKEQRVPTLIINGGRDLQVSVENAKQLSEAKPNAELLLIEEMNHVLKKAPEDREQNLATYGDPNLPLADGLMSGIIGFLQENGMKIE